MITVTLVIHHHPDRRDGCGGLTSVCLHICSPSPELIRVLVTHARSLWISRLTMWCKNVMTQHATESPPNVCSLLKWMGPGNQGHIGSEGTSLSEDGMPSTNAGEGWTWVKCGTRRAGKTVSNSKWLFFGVLTGLRSVFHLLILEGQWRTFSPSPSGSTAALSAGHTKTNRTICCPGCYWVKAIITFDSFFLSRFFSMRTELHRSLKQPSLVSKFNQVF